MDTISTEPAGPTRSEAGRVDEAHADEARANQDPLASLVWNALNTTQRHFALATADACRYVPEIAPFAALRHTGPEAVQQLQTLVSPGDVVYLAGELPVFMPGFRREQTLESLQMVLPADAPLPGLPAQHSITRLGAADAPAMLSLTTLTKPGPFRSRTYEMGSYYGIHAKGELIAMAGERMAVGPYREVSAVCTHPAHTGHGYAASLIAQILHDHRNAGLRSLLHVASTNDRAIELYTRLNFEIRRTVPLHFLTRID